MKLAACIVIENRGGFPGWWVFLAQEIQIGLKISFAAMGLFDLILKPKKTTAQTTSQDENKEGLE